MFDFQRAWAAALAALAFPLLSQGAEPAPIVPYSADPVPAAAPVPVQPVVPPAAGPAIPKATDIPSVMPGTGPAGIPGVLPELPAAPGTVIPGTPGAVPAADPTFKNVPPMRAPLRAGFFQMPPTGPGYYSILDVVRGDYRENPPKYGYPRFALWPQPLFEADFRYLDDPTYTEPRTVSEDLKRMKIGDNWMWSIGGQAWARDMSEYNSRLGQTNNNYLLARNRIYSDLWYKDVARLYVEGNISYSFGQNLPKLPTDQSGPDFLDLFVDLKVATVMDKPVYARIGRQELNFGSQRLVSSIDWSNTRRTFQGASVYRYGEKWEATAFWVQPVISDPDHLDWADTQQNFAGAWFTYKPKAGTSVDLYNLTLSNNNTIAQSGLQRGNYTVNTTGARFAGDMNNVLWDFEGAIQLGTQASKNVVAGMATGGLGYNFKDVALNPTLWVYYDYASGGKSSNTVNTFNPLFPFGHNYLGWSDLIGRQNIQDLNVHLYLYPTKWMTTWLQYHRFWLADSTDALYNKAGNVSRYSSTGAAGNDVGQEFDIINNFHLTKQSDIMVGYSYLYAGDFIKKTAAAGQTGGFDSSTFFVMYNFRW